MTLPTPRRYALRTTTRPLTWSSPDLGLSSSPPDLGLFWSTDPGQTARPPDQGLSLPSSSSATPTSASVGSKRTDPSTEPKDQGWTNSVEEALPTTSPDFEGTILGRTRHPPTLPTLDHGTNLGQPTSPSTTREDKQWAELGKAQKTGQSNTSKIGRTITSEVGRSNTSKLGLFVDTPKKLGTAGKVGQVSNASTLVDLPFTINSLETGEYVEKSARLERIPFSRCLSYFVVNLCPRFSLLWSRTFNFNNQIFRVVGVQARRGKDSFSKVIALKVETTTTMQPKQQQ